jgi:AcrR family transcriptional regulator
MLDLDKYHATKKSPTQRRSKETVRQILATAADLFAKHGVSTITTNDIADAAHIPIGSVYSYFDDKNSIISTLLELYETDLIGVMDTLADNPLLPRMHRYEVATIIMNTWSYYLEQNHPLSYVLFARSEPDLKGAVSAQQQRLQSSFCRLLHTKSPDRKHDNGPGSPCHLILQQGMAIVESSELLYANDHAARQKYLDMSIEPYCAFVESLK